MLLRTIKDWKFLGVQLTHGVLEFRKHDQALMSAVLKWATVILIDSLVCKFNYYSSRGGVRKRTTAKAELERILQHRQLNFVGSQWGVASFVLHHAFGNPVNHLVWHWRVRFVAKGGFLRLEYAPLNERLGNILKEYDFVSGPLPVTKFAYKSGLVWFE